MKRQFLMPSLLGAVLMLCLLCVQATSLRGLSMSTVRDGAGGMISQMDYTYGLPRMLTITTSGPSDSEQRHVRTVVNWGTIAAVLGVAWCVSMPIGRYVTGYARRDGEFAGPRCAGARHPAAIVAYVLAGCAIVGLVCGVVFERTMGASVTELAAALFTLLMLLA